MAVQVPTAEWGVLRVRNNRTVRPTLGLSRSILTHWQVLLVAVAIGLCGMAGAQGNGSSVDPKVFGLDLPPGAVKPGNGQCVATMDAEGSLVIARLYVQVGDGAIIMLPDGQLAVRKAGEYSLTERKFEPISHEELAKRLVSTEFKDFKVKQTKHYVYVYKSSDDFWAGTNNILETMLPGVIKDARAQGIAAREPEIPLVIVMFASQAEFQEFRRMPSGVTAYYHPVSNRVFLYEPTELVAESPELAKSQAISTVAHEGAHQILQNIGVQQRLSCWPMWLSEGMAEYFAPTSFGKHRTWKGAGKLNDLRMYELQQYLKTHADGAGDGAMIEQTVAAARLSSAGYASAWALTHFLAKNHRSEFAGYVREMSKLGPLEGNFPANGGTVVLDSLEPFRRHFGDDLASLETRLIAYLKRQPYKDPFAELPHFLMMIVIREGKGIRRVAEAFHSSALAERWAQLEIAKLPPEVQPSAFQTIKSFSNRRDAESFKSDWVKPR
jgi:hypothetical protein